MVTTAVNIANLTAVIISRTAQEADQVSEQISYAVNQELADAATKITSPDPYTALVSEHSGVRVLMQSTLVTSNTIAYLYVANVSGQIITDSDGRFELAANRHMIGEVPTDMPKLDQLADQNGYVQLARVLLGPPIYEYQKRLENGSFAGELHVGVSASAVGKELLRPIATNLIIGLVAIIVAATRCDRLGEPAASTAGGDLDQHRSTGTVKPVRDHRGSAPGRDGHRCYIAAEAARASGLPGSEASWK